MNIENEHKLRELAKKIERQLSGTFDAHDSWDVSLAGLEELGLDESKIDPEGIAARGSTPGSIGRRGSHRNSLPPLEEHERPKSPAPELVQKLERRPSTHKGEHGYGMDDLSNAKR